MIEKEIITGYNDPVMAEHKVVARHKKGQVIKGYTGDFSPNDRYFHLQLIDTENRRKMKGHKNRVEVDIEELKAAFFVKDFAGNKDYDENYTDTIEEAGRKAEVKFYDGEVITGYVMHFSLDLNGFFMVPADQRSNNDRVYVVGSSVETTKFY